jgi:hypothetical protein
VLIIRSTRVTLSPRLKHQGSHCSDKSKLKVAQRPVSKTIITVPLKPGKMTSCVWKTH